MRFTIGLRWKAVKVFVWTHPVFLLKTGFFVHMRKKTAIPNLRSFLSLSLGIHLVLLVLVSLFVEDLRIDQIQRLPVQSLPIEISLFIPASAALAEEHRPEELAKETREDRSPIEEMVTALATKIPVEEPRPAVETTTREKASIVKMERPSQPLDTRTPHEDKKPPPRALNEEPPGEELNPEPPPVVKKEIREEPLAVPRPLTRAISIEDLEPTRSNGEEEDDLKIAPPEERAVQWTVHTLERTNARPSFEPSASPPQGQSISPSPLSSEDSPSLPKEDLQEARQEVAKVGPPSSGEARFVQPKYLKHPKPTYPREARRKGYEGLVLLRVEILSNGRVGQIQLKRSSGYHVLDRSAMAAVKDWRFIPAKEGKRDVLFWANIPIRFRLQ